MTVTNAKSVDEEPEAVLINWRVFSITTNGRTTEHFCGYNTVTGTGRVSSPIVSWDSTTRTGVTQSGRKYTLADPVASLILETFKLFESWLNEHNVGDAVVDDVSSTYETGDQPNENVIDVFGLKFVDPEGFFSANPDVLKPMIEAMLEAGQIEHYYDDQGEFKLRASSDIKTGEKSGVRIRLGDDGELEESAAMTSAEIGDELKKQARKLN